MRAATPERRPAAEEISGVIERVTFHNEESGFCVLRVKARGQRDETTAVGSLPAVTAGEWLVAEGWWVRDKEHGLQFKAASLKTVPSAGLCSWTTSMVDVPLMHALLRAVPNVRG
jgi:exodeoxyribonuclease V alpha subunit